jgi:UDP-N-acetylglucosamine 4-epimerase
MKVLITGGAGFIGSNLCEALLERGYKVICLDNFITGRRENIKEFLENSNFKLIEGDIRNIEVCLEASKGVDVVLHQAAVGSVPRSIEDPLTTHQCNATGFINMLWSAYKNGVKRFIYASSSSVYGDIQDLPKVEERIGKPLSPYAVSKYTNELYAYVFSNIYGMEIIGLRYFNVFGKRQDPNGPYAAAIPKFFKALLNEESPVIYGDGETTRDFCHVDNVVQANLLAMGVKDAKAFNQVYNIAYGKQTTLNELFKMIKEVIVEYLSSNGYKDKAERILRIEPIYGPFRKGDIRHSLADITKARKLLGYEPKVDVKEGLRMTSEFYLKEISLREV